MPQVLRFGIHSLDEMLGDPMSKLGRMAPLGIRLPKQNKSRANGDVFTTSVCVVGPNGTGKSIFGLHMASTYLADCYAADEPPPVVFYVSTDFTFHMAKRVWEKFALDHPFSRKDPFGLNNRQLGGDTKLNIKLELCDPIDLPRRLEQIDRAGNAGENIHPAPPLNTGKIEPDKKQGSVIFVDMASHTAGDDWGFLHKLLSLLSKSGLQDPRHLVVIDAIEGFEALAGELNAFGEQSTRRSRVAQIMRLISGKCHALLVVEESKTYERLAEEFVVDSVIRLGNISTRNYERRVLKIEKVRGQSHVRGWHHYSIRSGKGSTTGSQVNPDDPVVLNALSSTDQNKWQSYVQVFHSVHRLNRKIMEFRGKAREKPSTKLFAAFGIKYLDNMLGGQHEFTEHVCYRPDSVPTPYYDTRGLPCSSTTALIGDSLTQKSVLGKAFLSRSFQSFTARLKTLRDYMEDGGSAEANEYIWQRLCTKVQLLADSENPLPEGREEQWQQLIRQRKYKALWSELSDHLKTPLHDMNTARMPSLRKVSPDKLLTQIAAWLLDYQSGQAIMLSTHNTHHARLAEEFIRRLHPSTDELARLEDEMPGYKEALNRYIQLGTICRRLEIHNLSSEILIHIVQQVIHCAQRKILTSADMQSNVTRYKQSWPIRLVIDDFSTFRDVIPELREDPLLLPTILFHFEREGITALIVDTQAGKPDTPIAERFESELRKLVQHNLYTWRVPFYGESRVAITTIPPFSYEYAGIVRELRWETETSAQQQSPSFSEPTSVDPHLELYTGLEEGKPQSVPLCVHLYAETPAMESYIATENMFLNEMFVPHAPASPTGTASVLVGVPSANYNEFRDFVYLQRDTRLDHTLVFQVDEFWAMRPPSRRKRAGAFQPQLPYLDAITADEDLEPDSDVDPYKLFQLRGSEKGGLANGSPLRRQHFYKSYYEDFSDVKRWESKKGNKNEMLIDRVPFIWDFGFLLCPERAWDTSRTFRVTSKQGEKVIEKEYTVRQVWQSLKKASAAKDSSNHKPEKHLPYVSWRIFIEACKKAAEGMSERLSKPVTAFDFAQISPESFSCLILEMWFSEIYDTLLRKGQEAKKELQGFRDKLSKRRLFISGKDDRNRKTLMLAQLLETYWLELYKSWLILIEVLNFSDIVGEATALNFDFKSRNTDFLAIASRHWYKTASQCPDEIAAKEPLVAVRLPGHFSVRGDWALAISGSSRSIRQGERVLDLLNSRRANVTRLQLGIGLPTRSSDHESIKGLRTKLISHERGQDNVDYGNLLRIGARTEGRRRGDFYWLWRSSLDDYSHCNRIWHKWLNRMLLSWYRNLLRYKSVWRNSFLVYDELTNYPPESPEKFAPSSAQLDDALEKLKSPRTKSSEEYKRGLDAYLRTFEGKVQSVAQLRVRGDFKELWSVLIEELTQAADEDRQDQAARKPAHGHRIK